LREQRFFTRTRLGRTLAIVRPTASGEWSLRAEPHTGCEAIVIGAICEAATGAIWIGGDQLASFEPDAPQLVAPPPAALVRRVSALDGKTLWGGAGPSPVDPFPADRNAVQFQFAAPSYQVDADGGVGVEYRTKLVGFDREWSPWGSDTQRTYTNLPPGGFEFRVQARADERRRLGPEARYSLRVLPPWWRTWWFMGVATVSGVGGVAGVTRWLANRALRRRVTLLEAQTAVERERLRLARDLHDEVGSGLGRVILFAGEAERAQGDATKLGVSLTRVRESAQDLVQHAREIVWAVSPQHDTLASVIERLGDYAQDTLRSAGIACTLEAPAPAGIPPVTLGSEARHSLFLAMKEAVHNCVKYSQAKTAEFRLQVTDDDFVVVLRDHGRGFAPGERHGSGHGTRNIVARAEALGGSATIVGEVGQGTTVTVRVPLPRNSPSS
jgi:signal transduction histidine kinase